MRTSSGLAITALALALTSAAAAQQIEISSPSIGTVVVTPRTIPDTAPRTVTRANGRGRTGVDLGIRRRADGSLYDPLDPAQNPAAATGASDVDANPGAANALNGSSKGGYMNPGTAAGNTGAGASAGAGANRSAGSGR